MTADGILDSFASSLLLWCMSKTSSNLASLFQGLKSFLKLCGQRTGLTRILKCGCDEGAHLIYFWRRPALPVFPLRFS